MSTTDVAKKEENTGLANRELTHSERFTNMVIKEFTGSAGELNLTNFQKKLIQNYFIKIDSTLKDNEQKRLAKKPEYQESIPFTWENVNMQKLSQDVVSFSSVGLDPCQKNHINLIPYGNTKTKKYDIGVIVGYVGLEIKAKKYGYMAPDDVIIEVVYSNDVFKPFKKDKNNPVETYEFEIVNPFDRGDIVGGFYYHNFISEPEKCKLRIFDMNDIEKRRPDKASAEFWGGEKDEWKDGKKTGKKVKIEGWFDEMVYKTIARAAYDAIAIDSEKIDENYLKVIAAENHALPEHGADAEIKNSITQRANKSSLSMTEDTTYEDVSKPALPPAEEKTTVPAPEEKPKAEKPAPAEKEAPKVAEANDKGELAF